MPVTFTINQTLEELRTIPNALNEEIYDEPSSPGSGQRYIIDQTAAGNHDREEISRSAIEVEKPESDKDPIDPNLRWTQLFEVAPEITERELESTLEKVTGGDIERKLQIDSIDSLAHYVPFHNTGVQYGIYIKSIGILQFWHSLRKFGWNSSAPIEKQLGFCLSAIMRHEAFHFEVERMVANLELVTRWPSYLKSKEFIRRRDKVGYILKEEELANSYMLRGLRYPSSSLRNAMMYKALFNFVKNSPIGYSNGIESVKKSDFDAGRNELAYEYHIFSDSIEGIFNFDMNLLYPSRGQIETDLCPIIFDDIDGVFGTLGIFPRFFLKISDVSETEKFKKMLVKMGENRIFKDWQNTKTKLLVNAQQPSLDLKKWPKGGDDYFSVRVNKEARAHLRFTEGQKWHAEEIGRHDQMDH